MWSRSVVLLNHLCDNKFYWFVNPLYCFTNFCILLDSAWIVVFAPYTTVTGITCKNVWDWSGFVKSCLFVELTVACCGLSRCSRVWCFLMPSMRHFIEQIQSFNKWVFEKQFLQIFSLAAKSILCFTGFILNSWQSISWCFSLHSQHVRPFFLSS